MRSLTSNKLFIPFAGVLAGFTNGLLGAGGGIIIVYALSMAMPKDGLDARDVFANALCVMLPISVVSVVGYSLLGKIGVDGLSFFILPAILGGVCGGFLLCRINGAFLKKLFSIIVIYSGVMLMIK